MRITTKWSNSGPSISRGSAFRSYASIQHLQPGRTGYFSRGRNGVKPCEGTSPRWAIPKVEYVFSAGYSYGPKGQDNLAQGLPWVGQKKVFSPEVAPGRECQNCRRKTGIVVPPGPFRAHSVEKLTQGKPWAKLSWPFGPQRSTLNPDRVETPLAPPGAPKFCLT
jgi:hypothetical protein